jgi:hypothetical protein
MADPKNAPKSNIQKKGGYQPTTNPKATNPPQGKKSGGTTQGKKA